MTSTKDIVIVETPKLACDGDKDSPHPRVFLTVNAEDFVDCPYCGRHFVLKKGAHGARGH